MHFSGHSSIIYNSQDMQAAEARINRGMDKENGVYTNNTQPQKRMQFCNKWVLCLMK